MDYPIIKYGIIRHRIQTKDDCGIFAMCRFMELAYRQKGVDVYFNEKDLEEKLIMAGLKKHDGGIDSYKIFKYIKENGFQGYKIKGFVKFRKRVDNAYITNAANQFNVDLTRRRLIRGALYLSMRVFRKKSERVSGNYYKMLPRTKTPARHAVVIVGWDGDGFEIQDSNYDKTHILRVEDFNQCAQEIYSIRT